MLLSLLLLVPAADWKPDPAPLMTRWGKEVSPDKHPWPEYPRPQLVRKDWLNLNGLWDYAIVNKGAAKPVSWDGKILVPYPVESALSGVGKHPTEKQELWYRRTLDAAAWKGKRVLLHFEAVDWETTVWVNGKELGTHRGMHDPFRFDITDALTDGKGELVVRVWDPTDKGSQPLGKQISNPHGIWYTPVTGIWQTVWMEPVGRSYITSLRLTPDLQKSEVECLVEVYGNANIVHVGIPDGGLGLKVLGVGKPGLPFRFKIDNSEAWSPQNPKLYDLDVQISGDLSFGGTNDDVRSYVAMRSVGVGPDEKGIQRLLLNGKPVFQYGPLDQGWWPDGLLTPPSDAAMKYDLEVLKKAGFNMVRKHIKVEPSRYYRYCDEMGFLVWQDMPSAINRTKKQFIAPGGKTDADDQFTAGEKTQFRGELKAMIDHLRGFGCIYCWVPFNEGWGQHDVNATLKWVKGYDPTRPVNGPSGWEDRGFGDMKDAHIYPGPGMFPVMKDRVSVLGEFGGLGLPVKGHLWKTSDNWGYRTYKTEEELRTNYKALVRRLHPLIGKGLAAAVYTQTTDVEVEVNGLMTYDREVVKFDLAEMKTWHDALAGPPPVVTEVLPTSEKAGREWSYTISKSATGWEKPEFDSAGWMSGPAGFGSKGTPGGVIRTEWTASGIWARHSFELKAAPAGDLMLRVHCDEDGEVYLNGVLAANLEGYTTEYVEVPVRPAAAAALKAGKNLLAVHAKNAGGGQYIDVGLVTVAESKK